MRKRKYLKVSASADGIEQRIDNSQTRCIKSTEHQITKMDLARENAGALFEKDESIVSWMSVSFKLVKYTYTLLILERITFLDFKFNPVAE